MSSFGGKVALITGGAGGIGAATANMLAKRGATVIATDINTTPGTVLQSDIEYMQLDVSSESQWQQVVASIAQRHGRLDVLVNAAGIEGKVTAGGLETTSLEDWRRVMHINLDGTFLGCREVMPVMKQQGSGSIVNISSLASYYPTLYSVAYGASKGAVTQLTKSVALAGSQGAKVRCNSVHPGVIATQMIANIARQLQETADVVSTSSIQRYASSIPLGQAGTPDDAAALIVFLASDEAGYITGSEFMVDGGSHLLR
ncbi:SDR family oxidoreductase [Pseudomonas sp. BN415]|uniref:SDR family NAD(P)-dependent oxidoreductase n=1 Tax=Pseudomonas sp. BN415 TaxID=2567889 RepID=UPI0024562596|nr:SDR family oxidoreductase [Pseudomonas sp. BN415]MDH4580745.1 SDR family oxidoreductase [Pseudomonas sp. BN415]